MLDKGNVFSSQASEGSAVGGMVVAVETQTASRRNRTQQRPQECSCSELDSLGIGTTEDALELGSALFLEGSHRALTAQGAIGEVIEEPALGSNGQVGVEWEVLGVLEGLKAIEDEWFAELEVMQLLALEEKTVAGKPGNVARDGGVGGSEDTGDLAQPAALGDHPSDGAEQLGAA